ncbi:MAG: hypothetical protein H7138_17740, partial [Myxococcales bacterium]|nr:hypothetical protein [Myxococcales bacterium]
MSWLIGCSLLVVTVAAGLGLVVHRNRRCFTARVARELRALLAIQPSREPLPAPHAIPAI